MMKVVFISDSAFGKLSAGPRADSRGSAANTVRKLAPLAITRASPRLL